jgi:hypothetical protein
MSLSLLLPSEVCSLARLGSVFKGSRVSYPLASERSCATKPE